jgi:hypothetical protein
MLWPCPVIALAFAGFASAVAKIALLIARFAFSNAGIIWVCQPHRKSLRLRLHESFRFAFRIAVFCVCRYIGLRVG